MVRKFVNIFDAFGKVYRLLAVLFLNILVLFILINFLADVYLKNKAKHSNIKNPVSEKYGEDPLGVVYPNLNKEEINDLLRETWSRPYIFESWTGLKERPYRGEYVNVDESGFRLTKDQGPWPPDRHKYFTVFLIGGSTTFGYGVPDNETIASFLQESLNTVKLGKDVRVYNFGRGYYYSTQERILFEQLIIQGFIPDMVIFIDGLNDFGFSYNTWQFAARFKILFDQALSRPEEYYYWRMIINRLPIMKAMLTLKKESQDIAVEENLNKDNKSKSSRRKVAEVENIINRYIQNKKIIESIANAYGVKSIFIWQPVFFYKYGRKYQLFYQPPDPRGVLGYSEMAKVARQKDLGNNFLWCADIQEDIKEPLYVDNVHYSGKTSKILAQYIADWILKNELISR